MDKAMGLDSQSLEKINTSILNRKPTYLAALLVDALKESNWPTTIFTFLGSRL